MEPEKVASIRLSHFIHAKRRGKLTMPFSSTETCHFCHSKLEKLQSNSQHSNNCSNEFHLFFLTSGSIHSFMQTKLILIHSSLEDPTLHVNYLNVVENDINFIAIERNRSVRQLNIHSDESSASFSIINDERSGVTCNQKYSIMPEKLNSTHLKYLWNSPSLKSISWCKMCK